MTGKELTQTMLVIGLVSAIVACSSSEDFTSSAQSSQNKLPPTKVESSTILFVSNQDGDREIFTVNSADQTLSQLTHNTRDDYDAVWSPDGSKILFTSNRDNGNSEVYMMNADGSEQVNLSRYVGFDGNARWSPNGEQIAFNSDRSKTIQLFIYDLASGNLKQISHDDIDSALYPRWSPDGKYIAYSRFNHNAKADTWVVSTETGQHRQLTNNPKFEDGVVDWTSDSQRLVYHSRRHRESNIYLFDLIANEEQQLTNLPSLDVYPNWSADGREIVFVSARGPHGRTQLCIMQEDGSQQRCITDARYQTEDPVWLGNKSSVLFTSWYQSRYPNVFLMDADTGTMTQLAPAKGYQSQPLPRPAVLPKQPSATGVQYVAASEGKRRNL